MPQTPYTAATHDPLLVGVSLGVAVLASYVTLDLARRVRHADGNRRTWWWGGGALVLGTGVWAMHFVAMLGLNLGTRLGYAWGPTLTSWWAAVAAAAVAFWVAMQPRLNGRMLVVGASAMTVGICGMHYIGMAALALQPGIEWDWPLVAASVVVAWVASAAALGIFFGLARLTGRRRRRLQGLASVVMGLAVVGMHFTGMAAARFPAGALCLSADELGGKPLAVLVTTATGLLMLAAMLVSTNEKLRVSRERRLNRSLHDTNLQLMEANAQLTRRAFTDALTGLPNRSLFEDRLQHALARVGDLRRRESSADALALVMVNLDGFKPVNESYGHAFGDRLLQLVAARLLREAREADTLARLEGDNFVLLIEGGRAAHGADVLAQRLLEALAQPFQLSTAEVRLSASIGIAVYPDSDASGQRLLSCADAAMQAAKASGGGGCTLYDRSMSLDVTEQVQLQQALRVALQEGQLSLHFQPKLKADTGELHGLEALLRWKHPQRGMVSPAVFVPLAERFGLIGQIGNWVIEEACRQLAAWHRQGWRCRVAINLSPHQLRQADLADRIADTLRRHQLHPAFLVCEMTETAAMENFEQSGAAMQRLIDVGIMLSIDDFGTGHSSLGQLRRIPARQLKVDRSFVRDLEEDPRAVAVLDAVLRLAHALGMEVVAEGVETAFQHQTLQRLGCDVVQGFLFAKPMPADEVQAWVLARQPQPETADTAAWAI